MSGGCGCGGSKKGGGSGSGGGSKRGLGNPGLYWNGPERPDRSADPQPTGQDTSQGS